MSASSNENLLLQMDDSTKCGQDQFQTDPDETLSDMDSTMDADERPSSPTDSLSLDLFNLQTFGKQWGHKLRSASNSNTLHDQALFQRPSDWSSINHRETTSEPIEQQLLHQIFKQNRMLYFSDSILDECY